MNKPPSSHRLRRGRVSEPGRAYLVTTVTQAREPVFEDLWSARTLIGVLMEADRSGTSRTLAFVVMPDHLHWLFRLDAAVTLSQVVQRVKSVSAHRIGRALWQSGFHDRGAREGEDVRDQARYIIANPLRAGLIERVGDYPHWDAIWI